MPVHARRLSSGHPRESFSPLTSTLFLMGPQGSGKGTQSERVRTQLNLGSIATGELFRAAIQGGTDLGRRIQAIYDRGELVPGRIDSRARRGPARPTCPGAFSRRGVRGRAIRWLPAHDCASRRTEPDLGGRGEEVTAVIAIDVPRQKLVERLAGRRVCSGCGRVYNVAFRSAGRAWCLRCLRRAAYAASGRYAGSGRQAT